jgi:NMD protein affecting ribosome stability and mRNA decay
MPRFYRRCHRCGIPDVTVRWREENLSALCVECHIDAGRSARVFEVQTMSASIGDYVRMSPAAVRAFLKLGGN